MDFEGVLNNEHSYCGRTGSFIYKFAIVCCKGFSLNNPTRVDIIHKIYFCLYVWILFVKLKILTSFT